MVDARNRTAGQAAPRSMHIQWSFIIVQGQYYPNRTGHEIRNPPRSKARPSPSPVIEIRVWPVARKLRFRGPFPFIAASNAKRRPLLRMLADRTKSVSDRPAPACRLAFDTVRDGIYATCGYALIHAKVRAVFHRGPVGNQFLVSLRSMLFPCRGRCQIKPRGLLSASNRSTALHDGVMAAIARFADTAWLSVFAAASFACARSYPVKARFVLIHTRPVQQSPQMGRRH